MSRWLVGLVGLALSLPTALSAQIVGVHGLEDRYLRVLQVSGLADAPSWTLRPIAHRAVDRQGASHPWEAAYPRDDDAMAFGSVRVRRGAEVFASFNSGHPRGQNDGAIWQGGGLTSAAAASATVLWRGLSVRLAPTVVYNQNAAFDLAPGYSPALPFAYPWRRIDFPQRFGPDGFWTFDPGQSEVSVRGGGAALSFGTANLAWGPARRNPIVMSGNAPGFRHASLRTDGPIETPIGRIEAQWIWGDLDQSDWFDPIFINEDRFITGLLVTWSPEFLPGLHLGGTRVFQRLVPEEGLDASEYLLALQGLLKVGQVSNNQPGGGDERDQLLSLFARWVLPESGFEAYLEWARNDHAWDFQDLIQQPEHSRGYTLGLQKVTSLSKDRIWVLHTEFTQLEAPATFQVRPRGTYYEHSIVAPGYTHRGQIIGAGVGPGGNAQSIGFDLYAEWGGAGLLIARQVHDNDAYWEWAAENGATFDRHDVAFDFGGHGSWFLDDMHVSGALTYTREINRYFFGPRVNNWNFQLSARWLPS